MSDINVIIKEEVIKANINESISSPVLSVNGQIGDVVLEKDDIGLGNVDNTTDADKPISSDTESALDLKQDLREIKTISTDTYILLETDNNKKLQFTNALGCTITIPTGLTLGNSYEGKQMEAGQLTFTNAVGVTLNKSATDTLKTADQYSVFGLDCTSTNKYVLFGKLELV